MRISSSLLFSALARPFLVKAAGTVHFTYNPDEESGPDNWKDLQYDDGTENACGGNNNSPIAIDGSACDVYANYEFQGGDCRFGHFGYSINSHGEQVNAPSSSGACTTPNVKIPGVKGVFELLQFHIHTSSEHSFDGLHFGAELHLVHKEIGGSRLAVMGLFVTPTAQESNDIFDHILAEFDAIAEETNAECSKPALPHFWQNTKTDDMKSYPGDSLDPYDLIPPGSTFYNYAGGLTTPPCSEIVEWSLVDKPIEISVAQYNDLTGLTLNYVDKETCEFATIADPYTGSTSRPVQPLNGRNVKRICPIGFVDEKAASMNANPSGARQTQMATSAVAFSLAISAVVSFV